jgi:hypothetical protein
MSSHCSATRDRAPRRFEQFCQAPRAPRHSHHALALGRRHTCTSGKMLGGGDFGLSDCLRKLLASSRKVVARRVGVESSYDARPPWPACTEAVAAAILASRHRHSLCIFAAWALVFAECPPAFRPLLLGAARSLTPRCYIPHVTAEAGGWHRRRVILVSPTLSSKAAPQEARRSHPRATARF